MLYKGNAVKYVSIGGLSFSKVICGTNPFYGRSHFSQARDAEYLGRFNDAAIEDMLQRCLDLGVNAIESCANERVTAILSALRQKNEQTIHFVGSTRIDQTSQMNSHSEKLSFLIENGTAICVIHAQYVDRPRKQESICGLDRMIDEIHSAGLLAGISTHRVETVELCERKDCGIDTYLFPLNLSGFVYPGYAGKDTVQERIDIVRQVTKPFILIKTLGAGRIPPKEALHFVAENCKPTDVLSLGFGTEDEIAESIGLINRYF